MKISLKHIFIAVILSGGLFIQIVVRAQSTAATLSGAVTDANGANVANASVTITSAATNFERVISANEDGEFVFANLPPAIYQVKVSADGFGAKTVENVALNVNDRRSLRVELTAGDVSATVTVEDNSREETAAVATTVDRKFVENIPLNGRSFQALIALTPGVVQTPAAGYEPGQFSVNGQRTSSNYYTVDGVSANFGIQSSGFNSIADDGALPAFSASGGTNALISIDALQEFKIQTSTYAPEFGRQPGGQIQLLSRSGTNQFNFTAFDYFRNDALDANNFFANRDGLERAALRQNDFGGTVGGPVFLPRFGEGGESLYDGRDRTFFFVSYEGLRLRLPQFTTDFYPTAAARLEAAPDVRALVNAFPIPNREDAGNGFGRFAATYSNPTTLDATSFRIDHNISDRLNVFGRFNYAPSSVEFRGGQSAYGLTSLNTVTQNRTLIQTLTFGSTQVFGGTLTNETRVNFSRSEAGQTAVLDDFGGAVAPDDAYFFPSFTSRENALIEVQLFGYRGLTSGTIADRTQDQFNLTDNFSAQIGDHQLKFGADYRRLTPDLKSPAYTLLGVFTGLGGSYGSAPNSPGLLTGDSLYNFVIAREPLRLRASNFSVYGQDTWRAGQKLTLTYGLRWEYNPPAVGLDNNPLYAVQGSENPNTATLAPAGTPLYETKRDAFAPRVGAAYQLFGAPGRETVLRGGFGLFYDLAIGTIYGSTRTPPYTRPDLRCGSRFPPTVAAAEPLPVRTTGRFLVANFFAPDFTLPRTYQFNFGVEQSLGANRAVSVTYVGALGRRLTNTETTGTNSPAATFGSLEQVVSTGESDYHALQAQFNQRLTRGLQVLASYTWAHSIDTNSNSGDYLPPGIYVSPQSNRGSSNFDIRHSFNGAVTYEIPRFRLNRLASALLNGWATDALFRAQTAAPVDVFAYLTTSFGSYALRPNRVAGQPLYIDDANAPGGRRFNRAAFAIAPDQQSNGNFGRNVLRGFPLRQIDLTLRRRFNLTERLNLQFRAEAFNVFNTTNFAAPVGDLDSPFFGESTQTFGNGLGAGGSGGGLSPIYQTGNSRSLQFALKLQF